MELRVEELVKNCTVERSSHGFRCNFGCFSPVISGWITAFPLLIFGSRCGERALYVFRRSPPWVPVLCVLLSVFPTVGLMIDLKTLSGAVPCYGAGFPVV